MARSTTLALEAVVVAASLIDRSRSCISTALRFVDARVSGHIVPSTIGELGDVLYHSDASVFAPVDYGVEIFHRMATVDRYNDWIYRRIEPHLGSRILEVGCGLRNMTEHFFGRDQLVSLDILPTSVDQVRRFYGV